MTVPRPARAPLTVTELMSSAWLTTTPALPEMAGGTDGAGVGVAVAGIAVGVGGMGVGVEVGVGVGVGVGVAVGTGVGVARGDSVNKAESPRPMACATRART